MHTERTVFQSQTGSIRRLRERYNRESDVPGFNPKLVRLEEEELAGIIEDAQLFQSQTGSIRSCHFNKYHFSLYKFQSQTGSIRRIKSSAPVSVSFQCFNPKLVRLEVHTQGFPGGDQTNGFNPKLVRLEVKHLLDDIGVH